MKTIVIEATHSTPAINFCTDGRLLIEGRSLPEDVNRFYKPLIEWIIGLQVESVKLDINLEYFNSASAKKLLELLKSLDANSKIKHLVINWHYEEGDDDALETGQIFEDLLRKAQFRYHEYAEAA
ncbi:MAG: DUF1987 domain-containing protein [Bacteroidales bacterium]|nr:DUF1987 domain-containing protein [Bacteroidales bacterium]MBN2763051.1 DUF1987 domain-containing protein [Bacteroidales bacterium]